VTPFENDAPIRLSLAEALREIARLVAEVEAFRAAVQSGVGPSCEDVCLVECIGVCGASSYEETEGTAG